MIALIYCCFLFFYFIFLSGSIGSHSLALTTLGQIYSWGVGHASGHGTIKPVPTPLLLKTFPIDTIEENYRKKLKLKNDQINNIFTTTTTTNTNTNTNTNININININTNSNSVNLNFENFTDIEEDSENTETDLEIMGIVDCQEIACG